MILQPGERWNSRFAPLLPRRPSRTPLPNSSALVVVMVTSVFALVMIIDLCVVVVGFHISLIFSLAVIVVTNKLPCLEGKHTHTHTKRVKNKALRKEVRSVETAYHHNMS